MARKEKKASAAVKNPALKILDEMNSAEWPRDMPTDVAINHDLYLAEEYVDRHNKDRTT